MRELWWEKTAFYMKNSVLALFGSYSPSIITDAWGDCTVVLLSVAVQYENSTAKFNHVKQLIPKFPLGKKRRNILFNPIVIIQFAAQKHYNSCFI